MTDTIGKPFSVPVDPTLLSGSRVMVSHGTSGRHHLPFDGAATMQTTSQPITPAQARQCGLLARRNLSEQQRRDQSRRICLRLSRTRWFQHARCIALYCASKDEVNLDLLIEMGIRCGKTIALPCIDQHDAMVFRAVTDTTQWERNRFDILQPGRTPRFANHNIHPHRINLICAPLSAFDAQFNRTGMGGGYYDRVMGVIKRQRMQRYIGTAFDCQQVVRIVSAQWDVPLQHVVTPTRLLPSPVTANTV